MTTDKKSYTDSEILGIVEEELDKDLKFLKANLKGKANSIKDRMETLIKRIDNDNVDSINDLGELQSIGVELDRLCGKIGYVQQTKKLINDFRATQSE